MRDPGDELILGAVGRLRLGPRCLLGLERRGAFGLGAPASCVERTDEQRHEHEDDQPGNHLLLDDEGRMARRHHNVERDDGKHRGEETRTHASTPGAEHHGRDKER